MGNRIEDSSALMCEVILREVLISVVNVVHQTIKSRLDTLNRCK